MKAISPCVLILLIALFWAPHPAHASITIDGKPLDWKGIPVLAEIDASATDNPLAYRYHQGPLGMLKVCQGKENVYVLVAISQKLETSQGIVDQYRSAVQLPIYLKFFLKGGTLDLTCLLGQGEKLRGPKSKEVEGTASATGSDSTYFYHEMFFPIDLLSPEGEKTRVNMDVIYGGRSIFVKVPFSIKTYR
ncbi:MAG: hypothetical protein HYU64_01165 [Armatimonadetes bacterium]|nr:hypothetical protein [Armatimonadota bacterium]